MSIAMLDVDHFKKVNDLWGHSTGDSVLKAIANTLIATLRANDSVIRWGGEEFMLVCPETGAKEAFVVADKVRRAVEDATLFEGLRQTVSAGVKDSSGCRTLDEQISGADDKLYEAKASGRNRVLF